MSALSLIETDWARGAPRLALVRRCVFVDEQRVPEALEWDAYDAVSVHWLALADAVTPIGCARLLPDGQIGRMAVLPAWRGRGVGQALLAAALEAARARGYSSVHLSAQVHAAGFYARAGFIAVGEPYEEAGILHVAMRKALAGT